MPGLMTILEERIASQSSFLEDPSNAISDFDPFRGRRTSAGPTVTEDNAKTHTAVFAAIQTISNSVASLPIKLYRRREDGGKSEQRDHPAWEVVHDRPNDRMTAADFKSWGQGHLLTRGNLYAEKTENGRGQADGLKLLNPDKVEPKLLADGTVMYVDRTFGEKRVFMSDEILHIRGMGGNGLQGWSPIRIAREAIAHGLAIQEYSAEFFSNSSEPSGILTTPESLSKEASERLKEQWNKTYGGRDNFHQTAVLEEGLSWEQIGLSAKDSQLIESEKLGWRKVAQIFGIQPHKIGDLEDATFSNISEQNLEYLQDTLTPWLVRWEQSLNQTLLSRRERQRGLFFEFVVDALMRGDPESRANMIETRISTGTWTINEVREMENEDPLDVPGADEPMVQLQDIPLSQAVQMSPAQRERMLAAASGEPLETREQEPEERQEPTMKLALRGSFFRQIEDRLSELVSREANDIRRFADRFLGDTDPEAFVGVIEKYYFGRANEDEADFTQMARDLLSATFNSYGESVRAAVASDLDEDEPNLSDFFERYTDAFIDRYASSSRQQLRKLAREAVKASERDARQSPEELAEMTPQEAIEERTREWEEGTDERRPRPEKWADRETVRMGEAVTKATMAAVGVQLIRWLPVGDSCPYCRQLAGTVIGVRKNFIDEGASFEGEGTDTPLIPTSAIGHPPAHPGCDCTIVEGSV